MKDVDQYGLFTESIWFSDPKDQKATEGVDDLDNPTGVVAVYWRRKYFELRSLFIMSVGLAGETGEVLEKIKKYVRDGVLDKDNLTKELGDVEYYWARIARNFQLWPSEIIDANVEKLESRRDRGVLRGSGDNR